MLLSQAESADKTILFFTSDFLRCSCWTLFSCKGLFLFRGDKILPKIYSEIYYALDALNTSAAVEFCARFAPVRVLSKYSSLFFMQVFVKQAVACRKTSAALH